MAKRALITGITGQDGSYLAEFLLKKGYEIHGVIRRSSNFNTDRIDHLYEEDGKPGQRFFLYHGDLTDGTSLRRIVEKVRPQEIYNLGAQSHVKVSFEQPEYTADAVAMGTLRLLDAVRDYSKNTGEEVRFYQAGSSEMFGDSPPPQLEDTPFRPVSPYAASKVAAHQFVVTYRQAYDLFACNGILFNHESPRRGETFVTRKITRALGRIHHGLQKTVVLGNLKARRDWGFAGDYVEAMWRMLQQDTPKDYVVATGVSMSVQEFLEAAAKELGINPKKHVQVDARYFRPADVNDLKGDASLARDELGWKPRVPIQKLVKMMVEHDLDLASRERTLAEAGHVVVPRGTSSH